MPRKICDSTWIWLRSAATFSNSNIVCTHQNIVARNARPRLRVYIALHQLSSQRYNLAQFVFYLLQVYNHNLFLAPQKSDLRQKTHSFIHPVGRRLVLAAAESHFVLRPELSKTLPIGFPTRHRTTFSLWKKCSPIQFSLHPWRVFARLH